VRNVYVVAEVGFGEVFRVDEESQKAGGFSLYVVVRTRFRSATGGESVETCAETCVKLTERNYILAACMLKAALRAEGDNAR
jgi:hypothetical protein